MSLGREYLQPEPEPTTKRLLGESPGLSPIGREEWLLCKALSDIETIVEITLSPGEWRQIPVRIGSSNLPQAVDVVRIDPSKGIFSACPNYLFMSVRSRYAQLGLDVPDYPVVDQIPKILRQIKHGERPHGPFDVLTCVINHSARQINLPEGTRLFRLYSNSFDNFVLGDNLVKLVESGEIKISGEQGKDWDWNYDSRDFRINNPPFAYWREIARVTGIRIRVKPIGWIPPDRNAQPIKIDDETRTYRREIAKLLKPIPEDDRQILWIGETISPITISQSLDAIIGRDVLPHLEQDYPGEHGLHINSRLIDGGTNWPVRVEILSATKPDRIPTFITLYLARSNG